MKYMLDYALHSNELTTDDPDDQVARPVNVNTKKLIDLILIATGPGSILKPTEVQAVIDMYWQIIYGFIAVGETYSDAYISTRFDISGVFANEDDSFDDARHTLIVAAKLKSTVTDAVAAVKLRKVDARKSKPLIEHVYDWGSETTDSQLSPGKVLEIRGRQLKVYKNLAEEGVWFINQTDGSELEATTIRTNEPKTLTLKIPALTAGDYKLEVRATNFRGSTLKVGAFEGVLTVS